MRLSTGCRTPSSNVASSTFGIDRASVSRSMSRQLNRTYRTRIVTSSTETRIAPALVYPRPAAAGLAKAAGGEFLLSAVPDSLPAGGRVDDCPGHPVEAVHLACDSGDGADRGAGLSLPHPVAYTRRAGSGNVLSQVTVVCPQSRVVYCKCLGAIV